MTVTLQINGKICGQKAGCQKGCLQQLGLRQAGILARHAAGRHYIEY